MSNHQVMKRLTDWKRMVKFLHFAGTVWFITCIGYILILTLRQAGVNWWIIFSLSGHSTVITLLLVSIYLYAIFRGVKSSKVVIVEHPLTSTNYYLLFYVTTPLLAGLTSSFAMIGENHIALFACGVALGTLGTTFVVWVIVDPIVASLELMLPQSRKSRSLRMALIKAEREKKEKASKLLLEQILEREQNNIKQWREDFKMQAENLLKLLTTSENNTTLAEADAIEIGVNAWQVGGLDGMKQLRKMTVEMYKEKNKNRDFVDYISVWWDGIGNWRNTSLC